MGTIVNYDAAEGRPVTNGVTLAVLIDSAEMHVSLLRVASPGRHTAEVPSGSDQYLFVIGGDVRIDAAGKTGTMGRETFAIVQEGARLTLTGGAAAAKVLSVVVPPPGVKRATSGFRDGVRVMVVKDLPVVDLPEEKKQRTYLASRSTVGSERGHAMIVRYTGDTVTKKHHHPNAESMFVMLEGYVRFLVNNKEETLGAGQAIHFPINDSHGLRSADGNELSFLEFHVPGAFVTQYDE